MRAESSVISVVPDRALLPCVGGALCDRQRIFEAIWTVESAAVRDGARACAQVTLHWGHQEAAPLLYELAETPAAAPVELLKAKGLLNRVVAYVDKTGEAGPALTVRLWSPGLS